MFINSRIGQRFLKRMFNRGCRLGERINQKIKQNLNCLRGNYLAIYFNAQKMVKQAMYVLVIQMRYSTR